jgi:hypothetical protein
MKEVLVNHEFFITPLAIFIRGSFTEAMTGIVMISLFFLFVLLSPSGWRESSLNWGQYHFAAGSAACFLY